MPLSYLCNTKEVCMQGKVAVSVRLNAHQMEETRKLARLLEISESEVLRRSLERGLQFLVQGRPEDEVLHERLTEITLKKGTFLSEEQFRKKYARKR